MTCPYLLCRRALDIAANYGPFDGLDEAGRGDTPAWNEAPSRWFAVMREIASRVPGPGCAVVQRRMVKTCKVGEGSGPDAAAELVRRLADPGAKPHQRCRASDAAAAGATVRVGCPTYHADEREPVDRVLEHWSAGIAAAGAETRHFAAGGGIGEPKLTAGRVAHHHQRGRAERAIAAGGHPAHAITGHDEAVAERKVIACAERRRRHPRTHGRGKLDQGDVRAVATGERGVEIEQRMKCNAGGPVRGGPTSGAGLDDPVARPVRHA